MNSEHWSLEWHKGLGHWNLERQDSCGKYRKEEKIARDLSYRKY